MKVWEKIAQFNDCQGMTKEQIASEVTKRLKNLAKSLNVNIMALSQLNKTNESPEPKLSRIRDSGQIVADADIVIFVYRPEAYGLNFSYPNCDVDTKNKALINIAKGRSIGMWSFICDFDCNTTKFSDSSINNYEPMTPNQNFESSKNEEIGSIETPF